MRYKTWEEVSEFNIEYWETKEWKDWIEDSGIYKLGHVFVNKTNTKICDTRKELYKLFLRHQALIEITNILNKTDTPKSKIDELINIIK